MNKEESKSLTKNWIDLGLGIGLLSAIFYAIPNIPGIPSVLHDFSFMAFGPLFSITAIGIYAFFSRLGAAVSNQLGGLFIFCAGLSATHMATMQMSIYSWIPAQFHKTEGADPLLWNAILTSVSSTQLGLDFAFDIFVSIGTVLLGWQVIRHPKFFNWLGIVGMFIGALGLVFNFVSFPDNPGNLSLVDPAPFFGVWMGIIVIHMIRLRDWLPNNDIGVQ